MGWGRLKQGCQNNAEALRMTLWVEMGLRPEDHHAWEAGVISDHSSHRHDLPGARALQPWLSTATIVRPPSFLVSRAATGPARALGGVN